MQIHRKQILCFDLDGTLINSKEAHAESYNLAFEKNKLQKIPAEDLYRAMGLPSGKVIKRVYPRISSRKLEQCVRDQKEFLITKCKGLVNPFYGVSETLEALSHKYILVLISTNKHSDIIKLAKAGGVDAKKFRIIIGEDEIDNPKPSPDAILEVKKLIAAPIKYMVGDTRYDIMAANAANVRSVGVLSGIGTFEQLWAEKPTHIISSIVELPGLLED